ncbi:signal peptidase I [Endozoicomonas sp. SCSIO W0465]|uniref:signal peptidase I n=1 Tax=Endozoicomonas sp. SCSIO W0465 TaxID=2918516 RepID=UPI0020761674|nr:signal peptidase I [Endozoicomonas sp. SCSIO W0465]USE39066.1 signal peptidase I [Endozoicomonas sp. SCSIO W0465]
MDFNFPLLLVLSVVVTGIIALFDRLILLPKRKAAVAKLSAQGADGDSLEKLVREPAVVETSKSIFPVLLFVLVIRSFLFEPFQIPSGSMIPTLEVGDFILVNKYSYGLRLPVTGTKVLSIGEPDRGDVMVFKQPGKENINFIKRVIGLPGDVVRYMGKQLTVNGQAVPEEFVAQLSGARSMYRLYNEGDQGKRYQVRKELTSHDFRAEGEWVVPEGMYFVMGDNRDRSNDSRYWGFVPEENIVGKAVYIWMHWPSWTQLPGFKNNGAIK